MAEFGTVLGQDGLKWWVGVVEDRDDDVLRK